MKGSPTLKAICRIFKINATCGIAIGSGLNRRFGMRNRGWRTHVIAAIMLLCAFSPAVANERQEDDSLMRDGVTSSIKTAIEETIKRSNSFDTVRLALQKLVTRQEFFNETITGLLEKSSTPEVLFKQLTQAVDSLAGAAGSAYEGDLSAAQENLIQDLLTTALSAGLGGVGTMYGGPVGGIAGSIVGSQAGKKIKEFSHENFWKYIHQGIDYLGELKRIQLMTSSRLKNVVGHYHYSAELLDRADSKLSQAEGIVVDVLKRLGAWEGVGLNAELAISECQRLTKGSEDGPSLRDVNKKINAARNIITDLGNHVSGICKSPAGIPKEEEIKADDLALAEAEKSMADAYDAAEAARDISIDLQTNVDTQNRFITEAVQKASSSRQELELARADAFEATKLIPGARTIIQYAGGVNDILFEAGAEINRCEALRQNLEQYTVSNRMDEFYYILRNNRGKMEIKAALDAIRELVAKAKNIARDVEWLRIRHQAITLRVTDVNNRIDNANQSLAQYDALHSRLSVCENLQPVDETAVTDAVNDATSLEPSKLAPIFGEASVCIIRNRGMLDSCRKALTELDKARAIASSADSAMVTTGQQIRSSLQVIESEETRAASICKNAPTVAEIHALRTRLDQIVAENMQQIEACMQAVVGICNLRERYITNPEILDITEKQITAAEASITGATEIRDKAAARLVKIRSLAANLHAINQTRNMAIDTARTALTRITTALEEVESVQWEIQTAQDELMQSEPYLQGAMAFSSCPLEAEVGLVREDIVSIQENIKSKLLDVEYAVFFATTALSRLKPYAAGSMLDMQDSFDAIARLSLTNLDGKISSAISCLKQWKPSDVTTIDKGGGGEASEDDNPFDDSYGGFLAGREEVETERSQAQQQQESADQSTADSRDFDSESIGMQVAKIHDWAREQERQREKKPPHTPPTMTSSRPEKKPQQPEEPVAKPPTTSPTGPETRAEPKPPTAPPAEPTGGTGDMSNCTITPPLPQPSGGGSYYWALISYSVNAPNLRNMRIYQAMPFRVPEDEEDTPTTPQDFVRAYNGAVKKAKASVVTQGSKPKCEAEAKRLCPNPAPQK